MAMIADCGVPALFGSGGFGGSCSATRPIIKGDIWLQSKLLFILFAGLNLLAFYLAGMARAVDGLGPGDDAPPFWPPPVSTYHRRGVLPDPTWLFLSLIPSGIGFVLFVYGKKQERWPQLAGGLAFMVYPYFATSIASLVAIGAALGLGLWLAIRAGW